MIAKRRLFLFGNGEIRFGDELNFKGAIHLGFGRAMRDFLAALALRRVPSIVPTPPVRVAHFAHDAIFHLRAVYGCAGISHRLAG